MRKELKEEQEECEKETKEQDQQKSRIAQGQTTSEDQDTKILAFRFHYLYLSNEIHEVKNCHKNDRHPVSERT